MKKSKFLGFGDCDDFNSDSDDYSSESEEEIINIKSNTRGKGKGKPAYFAVGGKMDANRSLTINNNNEFGELIIDKEKLVTKRKLDIYRGFDPKGNPVLIKSMKDVPRGLVFLLTQIKIGNKFNSLQESEKKQSIEMFKKLVTLAKINTNKGHKYKKIFKGGSMSNFEFIFFNSPQDLQKELSLIKASKQAGNLDNSVLEAKEQAILDKLNEITN